MSEVRNSPLGPDTDELRNRAEANDLRRFVFACPLSVCLDPEAISGSKAVRQVQRALPDGAGRAWRSADGGVDQPADKTARGEGHEDAQCGAAAPPRVPGAS